MFAFRAIKTTSSARFLSIRYLLQRMCPIGINPVKIYIFEIHILAMLWICYKQYPHQCQQQKRDNPFYWNYHHCRPLRPVEKKKLKEKYKTSRLDLAKPGNIITCVFLNALTFHAAYRRFMRRKNISLSRDTFAMACVWVYPRTRLQDPSDVVQCEIIINSRCKEQNMQKMRR